MKKTQLTIAIFALLCACSTVGAASKFYQKFLDDYATLDQDLLNHPEEHAEIKDFVYKKDLATFTFKDGDIHLLRYVDGRPTTAIFYGKGSVTMPVPAHVERMALMGVTKDSTLGEDFDICFIRMSDDFDLKLKQKFQFKEEELKWKEFNIAKQAQGEVYFKPKIAHPYDNYFELLRSQYERGEDGYFWVDFNRYEFSYDPNRPEEVLLQYEYEGGDQYPTDAVALQKQSRAVYADSIMSHIAYPTTMLDRKAKITMGGIDGRNIDTCDATALVRVNTDSLRFVSIFLHYNLKLDSMYFDGKPVDYYRRKDFNFIGVILPGYVHKGDTMTFRMWYKGKNYVSPMPYVEDPTPTPHDLTFYIPKGFNYLMPGMSAVQSVDNNTDMFTSKPSMPFNQFRFYGYALGYDTVHVSSDIGMELNLITSEHIDKKNYDCFVPDDQYRPAVIGAFNFLTGRLGGPPGVFGFDIYPLFGDDVTMPGVMIIPQTSCVTGGYMSNIGGIQSIAGTQTARQYFGAALRPISTREDWLATAASEYLGMLFVEQNLGAGTFYSNLASRRDSLIIEVDNWRDMPLASGKRASMTIRRNKGVWLLHMLRMLLLDINTQNDSKFVRLMAETAIRFNMGPFSNEDFITLAEKYYGGSLKGFFDQWLYGLGYPKFEFNYSVKKQAGGFMVDVTATTKIDNPSYDLPVLIRVPQADGKSKFIRQDMPAGNSTFTLGPFDSKPGDIEFNEFFSVLSEKKVSKK